ncbi:unnamed protein product [Ixodes persulcatus]
MNTDHCRQQMSTRFVDDRRQQQTTTRIADNCRHRLGLQTATAIKSRLQPGLLVTADKSNQDRR